MMMFANGFRSVLPSVLVAITLLPVADVAPAQSGPLADRITQLEQKLADARSAQRTREVGSDLIALGYLYRQAGKMQKALECLNEALSIEKSAASPNGQASALNNLGRVYSDMGQEEKALGYFNQALPIYRSGGVRHGEATTLNNRGRAYNNLGQRDEALKDLNDALAIWHEIDAHGQPDGSAGSASSQSRAGSGLGNFKEAAGRSAEASTLDNLGRTYTDMGRGQEALKYYEQALPIWREGAEQGGEALTLSGMGRTYADLGQKQRSLESYNKALSIWRTIGNRQGEASTLNDIGRLYRDLGLHQTALDYLNQALPIWREAGNRNGEALALGDIGRAYADMGQPRKALEFADQALPIFRETGSRRGEAMTLNNMGRDHTDLGEPGEAMKFDLQALAIWREVKDQRDEATDLMTIGWAYSQMKEPENSLASTLAALYLAKAAGDPEIEGGIETSLMMGFRKQQRPEEAIFFGFEAVNSYQQIRKNISGLEKDIQAGFAQSKSMAYRTLAELLVEVGRLGDAEQILDLLKEQELKDLVPGTAPGAGADIEPLKLSPAQQKAEAQFPDLEKRARAIEEYRLTYVQIVAKPARTPEDDAQLKTLDANIQRERTAIQSALFGTVFPELDAQSSPGSASADSAQSYLQNSLAKLGPRVMGIRLLLGEDHAYAIVVTAGSRKKIVLQATSADLRSKAFEVLKVLGSPSTDPRPQLNQLYAMIVAPVENDLKTIEAPADAQGSVPTLLWSLDDALRYVPMSALYDGRHYLVERFHNVLFTPESYGHMTDPPLGNGDPPSALAMGLSKSYGGLPALPGVIPELDSVVHDPSVPASHGPMQGKLLPDDQFTLAALKSELGAGKGFPVVHIASHFVLEAGSGDEPFLMMGGDRVPDANGYAWNLSDMENSTVAFHGTRLLTLSACGTAKDYKSRNGFEMDSLGMIAQQKDAEAVLATLWDVNDASTSRIMSDFYARWVKDPQEGKAEALRQAQLAFLRQSSETARSADQRGLQVTGETTASGRHAAYSHPYYWAPFVLIGNYR